MNMVLGSIIEHGSRAVRVFPPQSDVLIFFSGRIASEVASLTCLLGSSFAHEVFSSSANTSNHYSCARGSLRLPYTSQLLLLPFERHFAWLMLFCKLPKKEPIPTLNELEQKT